MAKGCDHSRAEVKDTDDIWNREGAKVIGKQEFIHCPDCDEEGWYAV